MASRNFTECARNGGKVVTKRTKNGKVLKICYDKEGGSHARVIRGKKHYNKPHNAQKRHEVKKEEQEYKPATTEELLKLKAHFDKMYRR